MNMINPRKRTAIAVTLLLSMFLAACSVYDSEPKRPLLPEGAVTGTVVSIEEAEKNLISFLNEEPMTRSGKTRTITSKFSLGGVVTKADGEEEEDLPGRSFIHPFYRSGTTSSNRTTDATYFLHITIIAFLLGNP